MFNLFYISALLVLVCAKPNDPKNRVYDKEPSDVHHYVDGEHNPQYDRDAFLGKDGGQTNSHVTPEQSQHMLGLLVTKIDVDKDGFVSMNELRQWLRGVSQKYIEEDVTKTLNEYKREFNTDVVTFELHKQRLTDNYDEDDEDQEPDLKKLIERDRKRFKAADINGDGKLTKDEFSSFLHPEEALHMRDIVIDETMLDLDLNEDGLIDIDEYKKDMYTEEKNSKMPDWVIAELNLFKEVRDKNGDGFLDKEEVIGWLFPDDYDHVESESKHLISEADDDKDGKLSKIEILNHHDLFMGSQATDFGQALRPNDEL